MSGDNSIEMKQKARKVDPSPRLVENNNLEQKLEKKLML